MASFVRAFTRCGGAITALSNGEWIGREALDIPQVFKYYFEYLKNTKEGM
jgi:hypothetical protein